MSNTWFLKDMPFDSDLDPNFEEAIELYYKKLGVEHKFLQRSEEMLKMYEDMD